MVITEPIQSWEAGSFSESATWMQWPRTWVLFWYLPRHTGRSWFRSTAARMQTGALWDASAGSGKISLLSQHTGPIHQSFEYILHLYDWEFTKSPNEYTAKSLLVFQTPSFHSCGKRHLVYLCRKIIMKYTFLSKNIIGTIPIRIACSMQFAMPLGECSTEVRLLLLDGRSLSFYLLSKTNTNK